MSNNRINPITFSVEDDPNCETIYRLQGMTFLLKDIGDYRRSKVLFPKQLVFEGTDIDEIHKEIYADPDCYGYKLSIGMQYTCKLENGSFPVLFEESFNKTSGYVFFGDIFKTHRGRYGVDFCPDKAVKSRARLRHSDTVYHYKSGRLIYAHGVAYPKDAARGPEHQQP